VQYAAGIAPVDRANVFLLGCSGGGHAALLAAEESPATFRAVDVWCPVSDLTAWHAHLVETRQHYYQDMEACLGGTPSSVPREYALRSPLERAASLRDLPVSIHHGRHDDVVPYTHSLEFVRRLEASGAKDVYFEVFDGEHEQFPEHSFEWFARLAKSHDAAVRITG